MRLFIFIIAFFAIPITIFAQQTIHRIKVTKKPQKAEVLSPASSNEVFKVVEVMPRLDIEKCKDKMTEKERENCSKVEMQNFVQTNIRYPDAAKKINLQGKVFVSFVIKADATMADFQIVRDIGGGCGVEALRVVKLLGEKYRWIAGSSRGKAVDVLYNFPVSFGLK